MKFALIGATGLVGSKVIEILQERDFPVTEFIPVASERSAGREIRYKGTGYKIIGIENAITKHPDIAMFSAGSSISLEWAPKFADAGTTVIDNSSAWRMNPGHKLIVPEINAHLLTKNDTIIANPNCSTIQMVMALAPLHKKYGINRIVVSTYQSVTGSGRKAVDQLMGERKPETRNPKLDPEYFPTSYSVGQAGRNPKPARQRPMAGGSKIVNRKYEMVYPYQIDLNVIPHIGDFEESGYTKEEVKMINETRKILGDDSIKITATTVRIPVLGGHSESVNVEFIDDYDLKEVRNILKNTRGIVLKDDAEKLNYPMPIDAQNNDKVLVGRLRRDDSQQKTLNMWIVSDNLRKGAATNAVQIAEYIVNDLW
ncbi:MAG: aspartate-semialdehyde dehydrogenase [Cytophagales bacterium]|nr:aspartate-semialdehyde dehydrogenase [Cytophagales bacterium]